MKRNMSTVMNRIAGSTAGIVTAVNLYLGQAFAIDSGVKDLTGNYKSGIKAVVGYIGGLIGLGIVAFAVFNLVMAVRNEDSEGRNKALLNLVAGAALTAISAILAVFLGK